MQFIYKGLNKKNEPVSGSIEVKDLNDAKSKLKQQGILFSELKEKKEHFNLNFFKKKQIPSVKLSSLSNDLSVYMKAGVPLVNAVKLARTQYKEDITMYSFLNTLVSLLEEGKSFYQALETQTYYVLPQFYLQSIKISENGGMIEDVLIKMASFLREQEKINKKVKNALSYPLFIIFVATGMVTFMLTVVVPKITAIFENLNQELPLITKIVLACTDFLTNYGLLFISIFITVIVIIKYLLHNNSQFRYNFDLLILNTPLFGKLIEIIELGRFSYMSSVLLKSGIPFVQTIKLGANTLKNSVLRDGFNEAGKKVVEGEKLSFALNNLSYKIEPSFIEAITLGEETSEIASILENLSILYFEKNQDKIDSILSLLEPILMLLVGAIIGVIITAMLLPIFSISM
jgi:general secretion pathway protein F/type IV pilus assembly protein PilC